MTRAWLWTIGLASIAWGVLYSVVPHVLTDPSGYGDLAAEATTDVRGTYGGLQLALGLFFVWCALDSARHRMARTPPSRRVSRTCTTRLWYDGRCEAA